MKIAIIGGGSWGTALGILWARHGNQVTLWTRTDKAAHAYREANCNTRYLPDYPFPPQLEVTHDIRSVFEQHTLIVLAVPLQTYREFMQIYREFFKPHHHLILLSKGLELDTHFVSTQIVFEVLGEEWRDRTFVLSGPSFAKEVAANKPTAVVLAGDNEELLTKYQEDLYCHMFRLYRNKDVLGVQLGGALKNIIAIAGGMADGLDLGHNTNAALITRGIAEMSRLGEALGAKRETFGGLAGVGDLILTCTGQLSRNRKVGMELAKGHSLDHILENLGMVAEGVKTCASARELGMEMKVEMPITYVVYEILYNKLPAVAGLRRLMTRELKEEHE